MNAFVAGMMSGLEKAAKKEAIGEVVDTVIDAVKGLIQGDEPVTSDTVLPELLDRKHKEDVGLETLILFLEEKYDMQFTDEELDEIFVGGTVSDVASDISEQLMNKTAVSKSHQYYLQNRARVKQRNRQYRMAHMHQIRRRSMIYRAQVKRQQRRPRRRVGSGSGGFSFVMR